MSVLWKSSLSKSNPSGRLRSSVMGSEGDPKARRARRGFVFTVAGLTAMASSDVDGGAARIYRREGGRYPSDLRDAELARLAPMIPPARPGGRPCKTDMRVAMNVILCLLRTGCP